MVMIARAKDDEVAELDMHLGWGRCRESAMATDVIMKFDKTNVTGTLNDTETARAFAEKLPVTIHVGGTGMDFCGLMPFELPYEPEQVHFGWTNGDINYNPEGGWFALLFAGEEVSAGSGDQLVMGRVTSPLDVLHELSGSYDLVIERA